MSDPSVSASAGGAPGPFPYMLNPPSRPAAASPSYMSDNAFYRFLGGHPIKVILRLLLISLVVGALLLWLDIKPVQVIEWAQRIGQRIYGMGFDAVKEAGQYIMAGAIVVVPVWFVLRLLGSRTPR